jgi:hypothetical protein
VHLEEEVSPRHQDALLGATQVTQHVKVHPLGAFVLHKTTASAGTGLVSIRACLWVVCLPNKRQKQQPMPLPQAGAGLRLHLVHEGDATATACAATVLSYPHEDFQMFCPHQLLHRAKATVRIGWAWHCC